MMGENLASGSLCDIVKSTTQLEVDSHRERSSRTFNKATDVAALAGSMPISTMKKPLNKCNNSNNAMLIFLFSVIGLSLLSLSELATMANAQTSSSNSTSGTNSTSNETTVKQMGICQVGVKSACNGDSNSPK